MQTVSAQAEQGHAAGWLTVRDLRRAYGLSTRDIARLGRPDKRSRAPRGHGAPPETLYRRDRIEALLCDGVTQPAARERQRPTRRVARDAGRSASSTAVLREVRQRVACLLADVQVRPTPDLAALRRRARRHYTARYPDFDGAVTDRALCSFIRHALTDYDQILAWASVDDQLYRDVKLYLCARIISAYGLPIAPERAAWGEPAVYMRENVVAVERRLAHRLGVAPAQVTRCDG